MILIVLFAIGFFVALVWASLFRHARGRLLLVAGAIVICAACSIYVATMAPCPEEGECDKGLTIIFLGAGLVGWLLGAAASWLVRRSESRSAARQPPK
jgi:hypothetical protein